MNSNVLGQEENLTGIQMKSLMRAQMKIQHLNQVNGLLRQQIAVLTNKFNNQQNIIKCLTKQQRQSQQLQSFKQIIINLGQQNKKLQKKFLSIIKQNQSLMTERLLKEQTHQQAMVEYSVSLNRYQKKIFELRQAVQQKQIYIQGFEEKLNKNNFIELPGTDSFYLNKFCNFLEPYQKLINQLRNDLQAEKIKNKTLENSQKLNVQTKSNLKNQKKAQNTQHNLISCQSSKLLAVQGSASSYNLKPTANSKTKMTQQQNLLYLKTSLKLKEVQNELRKAKTKIKQYQFKDKIMKDGYNILTKKIEELNNQLFSTKIKNKSLTLQSIKNIRSQSTIFSQFNKQEKVQSQTNCSSKHYLVEDSNLLLGGNIKAQSKLNQRIQQIQENLSVQGNQEANEQNNNIQLNMCINLNSNNSKESSNTNRCPTERFQNQLKQKPVLKNKESKKQLKENQKDISLSIDFSIDQETFQTSEIKRKRAAFELMEEIQFE